MTSDLPTSLENPPRQNAVLFQQQSSGMLPNTAMQGDSSTLDPVFPRAFLFPETCSGIVASDGTPHPHWQGVFTYLNSLGSRELERRWQKARQIMHEHGVAYNVFNDDQGQERPWELDPIPLPIAAQAWPDLEKGVAQRTRLLAAIHADIYGSQTLIHQHHLPPELFFANPKFLRQCHGIYREDAPAFHFHATDLCRFSDGVWRVVAHRTQSPSGAGYALENRIILSRILPRMFHSGKVMRLAPFFKSFNHALMEISGLKKREPSIVMLSPGPSCPTYFEHVFLSRYMGFTLVESSDLTVRNDAVFLKTLKGLHPVDVILRRLQDTACDPLVFGNASLTGIPGLVQAVRSGNVAVANPIGSGVLETPALVPFLPGLCRLLLGESLLLEDVPTVWCGQRNVLNTVLSRISDPAHPMIISSAFASPEIGVEDTRAMSPEKIATLTAKIKAMPHAYVAREPMTPCTLPVWEKGNLINASATMRLFSTLVTHGSAPSTETVLSVEDAVFVMPGALTLVSRDAGGIVNYGIAPQGGSKDTWCFTDDVVEHKSMMTHFIEPLEIHRGSDLPSRVADNMLWLGRYVERTEGMLRVIRSVLTRLNSETRLDIMEEFPFLLRAMAALEIIAPNFSPPGDTYSMQIIEAEILACLFDAKRPGSIISSLLNVKRVAASVRDRLSIDSWHILGRMEKEMAQFSPHRHSRISEAQELVNEMILTMSAFAGLALESMTRAMGWRFMDMGRRLERSGYMISLLQSLFASDREPINQELEALLEVADSTITYHTRYRTILQVEPIVDLLLLDELNPRAVGFQMAALFDHVETLPGSEVRAFKTKEEKITLDLTTQLRLTDIRELMEKTQEGKLGRLTQLLDHMDKGIISLANHITQHYLSRIETEKQLGNFGNPTVLKNEFSQAGVPYAV
ncbi:circularly permuted type 2 ATP-grasp protein [Desulfocicer niacini]